MCTRICWHRAGGRERPRTLCHTGSPRPVFPILCCTLQRSTEKAARPGQLLQHPPTCTPPSRGSPAGAAAPRRPPPAAPAPAAMPASATGRPPGHRAPPRRWGSPQPRKSGWVRGWRSRRRGRWAQTRPAARGAHCRPPPPARSAQGQRRCSGLGRPWCSCHETALLCCVSSAYGMGHRGGAPNSRPATHHLPDVQARRRGGGQQSLAELRAGDGVAVAAQQCLCCALAQAPAERGRGVRASFGNLACQVHIDSSSCWTLSQTLLG